eukprot:TRINITY_DN44873_c0_g1_i1.p1 TRINITY_DN44873_c0_g1~~TRINITY_DN44873_c0_g1_i1.p1  ORF type:complete len:378 (+),score=25.16 TRINITY_DN44873_c0_g1_i1:63-1136(+)
MAQELQRLMQYSAHLTAIFFTFCWLCLLTASATWHIKVSYLYRAEVGLFYVKWSMAEIVSDVVHSVVNAETAFKLRSLQQSDYSISAFRQYMCAISNPSCTIWSDTVFGTRLFIVSAMIGIILMGTGAGVFVYHERVKFVSNSRRWAKGLFIAAAISFTLGISVYWFYTSNIQEMVPAVGKTGFSPPSQCVGFAIILSLLSWAPASILSMWVDDSTDDASEQLYSCLYTTGVKTHPTTLYSAACHLESPSVEFSHVHTSQTVTTNLSPSGASRGLIFPEAERSTSSPQTRAGHVGVKQASACQVQFTSLRTSSPSCSHKLSQTTDLEGQASFGGGPQIAQQLISKSHPDLRSSVRQG